VVIVRRKRPKETRGELIEFTRPLVATDKKQKPRQVIFTDEPPRRAGGNIRKVELRKQFCGQ
jgi:hypothetical protein